MKKQKDFKMKNKILITILMALIAFSLMAGPGDPIPKPKTGNIATTSWADGNVDVYLYEGTYHIEIEAWITTDDPLDPTNTWNNKGLINNGSVQNDQTYDSAQWEMENEHTGLSFDDFDITQTGWYTFRGGAYAIWAVTVNQNYGHLICDSYEVPEDPK